MSVIERALKKTGSDDNITMASKRAKRPSSILSNAYSLENMREDSQLSQEELNKLGIVTDMKTANAFRDLRTELVKAASGKNFVLAVSSCVAKSGNTFVATNIAVSIAQDVTKSAIIIDCNFRNPSIAENFSLSFDHDLTDYLSGKAGIEEIIYPVKINTLRVVPCKKSNLSEIDSFTTSSKLGELIYELKNKYPDRCVILDVSDVESSADAKILDLISDYSILVAGHDTSTPDEIQAAIDAFNPNKFLGVVYNNCPI